jgi:hypothetical protein
MNKVYIGHRLIFPMHEEHVASHHDLRKAKRLMYWLHTAKQFSKKDHFASLQQHFKCHLFREDKTNMTSCLPKDFSSPYASNT